MIGFYSYTVILTYIGMLSSVFGMFLAIRGGIRGAAFLLLFAGLCDMFDGKIARTKKNRSDDEKSFGIQIDSLSDVICFGVFPAILGYCVGCTKWWQLLIGALFVLCGLIRLAYFNVTEQARQQTTSARRDRYLGLPITTSAILVPLLLCFRALLGAALPLCYSLLLLVLGICYICPVSVKKPGAAGAVVLVILGCIAAYFILT